jgi:hypothetical protein
VYVEFTAVVRRQKEILKKLVERKQAEIRKIHPGLTCFRYSWQMRKCAKFSWPIKIFLLYTLNYTGSVSDPDLHWILIRWPPGSGSRRFIKSCNEGKITAKKQILVFRPKKYKKQCNWHINGFL